MSDPTEIIPDAEEVAVVAAASTEPPVVETSVLDADLEGPLVDEDPTGTVAPVAEEEVPAVPEEPKLFLESDRVFYKGPTWNPEAEIVDLPAASGGRMAAILTSAPNIKYPPKWVEAIKEGVTHGLMYDQMDAAVSKEGARYTQGIESLSGVLRGLEPRFADKSNQTLTGDTAVLRALSHLGMGTLFQVPLWHTGIWVTIRAPSESQLLELQRQLIADKIRFGRQTYGLIFSNTSSYTVDRLVSFVLQQMHSTTLKDSADLREIFSSHDIPALLWGLTCSVYPRGFQYRRACTVDPAKCNHVIEERLNVTKLQWTNTTSLTAGQKKHMTSRRIASMTKDDVLSYQKELLDCQNREVVIYKGSDSETKLTLRVPTVAEYIDAGHQWIGEIVAMVNTTLGMDADENERNEYIFSQGQSTALRQYSHWITSIELGDKNIVEGKDDISAVLGNLSADDDFRDEVMAKMKEYIASTAMSLIGIPTYECPACGKEQPAEGSRETSVIVIDMIQVFFTLLMQKTQRLKAR